MDSSSYKFLDEFLTEEQANLLKEDIDKIHGNLSSVSDEERFKKALNRYSTPILELFQAIRELEAHPNDENIRNVIHCAVNQHDFVTALYWHKKLCKGFSKITDKFERYYYSLMAELQKKHQPDAVPYTSAGEMIKNASDMSKKLRDPKYLEHTINYRTKLAKAYQEKFDSMENSVIIPAKKKEDKATAFQFLIGFIILIAGGIFLFKSYGVVARAVKNALNHTILFLISWAIPIIYAILLIIIVCVLIYFGTKNFGKRNKSRLKKSINAAAFEIKNSFRNDEDFCALQEMNKDINSDFHNYDSRLILAALSAITGEQDIKKLSELPRSKSSWLSEYKPFKRYEKDTYKNIDGLIKDGASDTDLFLAYTLTRKLWAKYGLSWYQSIAGLVSERHELTPADFVKREEKDSRSFIEKFIDVPFGGDNRSRNSHKMFEFVERFLVDEAIMAENAGDYNKTGHIYYVLYRLCKYKSSKSKMYVYGTAGFDYSEELRHYVMQWEACYDEYHEYYDPYASLGYTRNDAKAYARELDSIGDPFGKVLWDRFKEVDRRQKEREEEARAAEARAYWEEQSRLRQEAEAAREKARAELNARMDSLERNANLLFNGQFATTEERILGSNMSDAEKTMAQINHDTLREAAIRKKLDDM